MKVLKPPTLYYRWFLFAARYHIGRATGEVPEYLKKWQTVEFGFSSQPSAEKGSSRQYDEDGEETAGDRRQSAYSVLGLGNIEEDELGL